MATAMVTVIKISNVMIQCVVPSLYLVYQALVCNITCYTVISRVTLLYHVRLCTTCNVECSPLLQALHLNFIKLCELNSLGDHHNYNSLVIVGKTWSSGGMWSNVVKYCGVWECLPVIIYYHNVEMLSYKAIKTSR